MMNTSKASESGADALYLMIIHDRNTDGWIFPGRPYPVQKHAVAFSGRVREGETIECCDDGNQIVVTFSKDALLCQDYSDEKRLEWVRTDAGDLIAYFMCEICDAVEGWSFTVSQRPIQLQEDSIQYVEPGVFVRNEDVLYAEKWDREHKPPEIF